MRRQLAHRRRSVALVTRGPKDQHQLIGVSELSGTRVGSSPDLRAANANLRASRGAQPWASLLKYAKTVSVVLHSSAIFRAHVFSDVSP